MVFFQLSIVKVFRLTLLFAICVDFYFGSSHYEATFVETDYFGLKTWNDLKEICEQSGYQLVSITSSDENDAILNFLQDNCTRGNYAIGLSRQMGMDQHRWNWESDDTAMELLWGINEPNVPVHYSAVVYMTTLENLEPGKWYDIVSTALIGAETANPEYGYICEKSITTTQLSTTTDGMSIQSFSRSIIPLSSTYRMHTSVVATVNGEPKDRTGISDEPITKTNTENNKATQQLSTTAGRPSVQPFTSENKETTSKSDKPMKPTSDKGNKTVDLKTMMQDKGKPITCKGMMRTRLERFDDDRACICVIRCSNFTPDFSLGHMIE
ncbi:uncharacterized protein LOC117102041 [Anneissia japonica]|uniref:uncharacterized protein LOC117102041 n=1 Tax=Anneissia japonica TaxID=1529436 RepID=UPI001425A63A|nr:uncharacterized protein LOC117102041 [Anneissia japonica]